MDAKKQTLALIAEIDPDELAARLLEVGVRLRRPTGQTGKEAMAAFRAGAKAGTIPAYIVEDFEQMSVVAIKYLAECINGAVRPS